MIAEVNLPHLCRELLSTGIRCDVVGFDACLMSMVEVAYEVSTFADFMVASEPETGAGDFEGWTYDKILSNLRSDTLALDLGMNIVETYGEGDESAYDRTIAVVRLVDMMGPVKSAFSKLASHLTTNYTSERCGIQAARTKTIEQFSSNAFADALALLANDAQQGVGGGAVAEAQAAVENAFGDVRRSGTNAWRYSGISIFYPLNDDTSFAQYSQYAFAQATGWGDFVTRAARDHESAVLDCPNVMAAAARRFVADFILGGGYVSLGKPPRPPARESAQQQACSAVPTPSREGVVTSLE